ncbi:hypothetical protein F383_29517 [Gossypium arboreum]|uniref:Uncharacterized protein n=1 Tax=Gossypium arboreum TaxID=29729 RepID=A0A0B0MUV2_GOSAR|nr:hypothetical protein F383_29517 [Gossypium arboreum]
MIRNALKRGIKIITPGLKGCHNSVTVVFRLTTGALLKFNSWA